MYNPPIRYLTYFLQVLPFHFLCAHAPGSCYLKQTYLHISSVNIPRIVPAFPGTTPHQVAHLGAKATGEMIPDLFDVQINQLSKLSNNVPCRDPLCLFLHYYTRTTNSDKFLVAPIKRAMSRGKGNRAISREVKQTYILYLDINRHTEISFSSIFK